MTHLQSTDPLPVWVISFSWQRPARAGFEQVSKAVVFLSHRSCSRIYIIFLFSLFVYLIPSRCTPPALSDTHTHTHTHPPTRSLFLALSCSSHTKEIVLASGIYQGWNVFRERMCLWIWAHSTHFMRKYWIELNSLAGFSFFFLYQKKGDNISLLQIFFCILRRFHLTKTSYEFPPSAVSLNKYPVTFPVEGLPAIEGLLLIDSLSASRALPRAEFSSHQKLLLAEHLRSEASNWIDRVLIDV